jgi:dynein assembly factor 6, axonemal
MDIAALSELLKPQEDTVSSTLGAAWSPRTGPLKRLQRPPPGSAAAMTPADFGKTSATAAKAEPPVPRKGGSKDIWATEEVATKDELDVAEEDDGRARPVYDILYKQSVTSEDMYLGLGDKDPSSTSCEMMVIKVKLPGERLADIDLQLKPQAIEIRSPRFKLATYLPHRVAHGSGKAKWLAASSTLQVQVPIQRKALWELEEES